MAEAPAYNPSLTSKEALVGAGYSGYQSWNDEASIMADYKATGGADKYTGGGSLAFSSSSGNLPAYLQNFQETAMKSLSALKPVGVPTFEELKNNLMPDTPAPELLNRAETRQQMRETLGVTELEAQLNSIKDQETKITDDLRALTGTEEGKPVAMNVISGRISEEERVAQQRLDAVIRQKNSVINELNTKYNVINTYINDLGLDYQDAVTAYNTDFERNFKVQSMITDMSSRAFEQGVSLIKTGFDITMDTAQFAQQIRQAEIDNARANLTTMMNAISSGNLSYDSMSSDQKLQIQKLEIQSGLPVGTMSGLGISAKDKILAFSSDNTQAWVVGSDGNMQVISTGLKKASGASGSVSERQAEAKNEIINKVKAAAAHKVELRELIGMYAGVNGVTATEVYEAYNQTSPWGAAKETPEELAKLGIKTISNTSTTDVPRQY